MKKLAYLFLLMTTLAIGQAIAQDWQSSYQRGVDNQTSTLTTPTQTMSAVTACSNASPMVCTWTANALVNGMGIVLTGAVPNGAVSGQTYYVTAQAANSFELATIPVGGTPINSTSASSPTATIVVAQNAVISSNADGPTASGPSHVPALTNVTRSTSGSFKGLRLRVKTNVTSGWDQATFTVRLYDTAPTYAVGAGNFQPWAASGYAGFLTQFYVTLTQFTDGASGSGSMPDCGPLSETLTGGGTTIYMDIQYTGPNSLNPISAQTFTLVLEEEK